MNEIPRREFLRLAAAGAAGSALTFWPNTAKSETPLSSAPATRKTPAIPKLALPLAGNFRPIYGDQKTITVQGPHRFLKIGPVTGYQPTSPKTVFHIFTD